MGRNREMCYSYLVSLFPSVDRCYRLGIHFPSHTQSILKCERDKLITSLGSQLKTPRPGAAHARGPDIVASLMNSRGCSGHTDVVCMCHDDLLASWIAIRGFAHYSTYLRRALLASHGPGSLLQHLTPARGAHQPLCHPTCPSTPASNAHHRPPRSQHTSPGLYQALSPREATTNKRVQEDSHKAGHFSRQGHIQLEKG